MPRTCTISDCPRPHEARGYCRSHYARFMKHGDPLAGRNRTTSPEASFAARTVRDEDTGCLLWTGNKLPKGYGQIWDGTTNIYAHRYAWERVNGPIPAGMKLDHRDHCSPSCCEVAHLRLATNAENLQNRSGAATVNRSTGIRNVYPEGNRFRVQATRGGKSYRGGTFTTIAEAIPAAEALRAELFGEFKGRG